MAKTTKRRAAKKAVGFAQALLATLRDPIVKKTIDEELARYAQRAADKSPAGQTQKFLEFMSNPAVVVAVDSLLLTTQANLERRKR